MTTKAEELKVKQLNDDARDALGGEDVIFVLVHRMSDGHTLLVPSNLYGTLQKNTRRSAVRVASFSSCGCQGNPPSCYCDFGDNTVNLGPCPRPVPGCQ